MECRIYQKGKTETRDLGSRVKKACAFKFAVFYRTYHSKNKINSLLLCHISNYINHLFSTLSLIFNYTFFNIFLSLLSFYFPITLYCNITIPPSLHPSFILTILLWYDAIWLCFNLVSFLFSSL